MIWLITKLVECVRDIIFGLLSLVTSWFTGLLSLNSSAFIDLMSFQDKNYYDLIYQNVILPCGIGILLFNMVYHLYKSMWSKKVVEGVEEPISILARSLIFLTGIICCKPLFAYFTKMFTKAWKWLNEIMTAKALFSTGFTFDSIRGDSFGESLAISDAVQTAFSTVLEPIKIIISIVIGFVLGWKFIKLMIVYVGRFVLFQIVQFTAPMGLSLGGSAETAEMSKRYLRLFASTVVSLFLSAILTYFYMIAMTNTLTWSADGFAKNLVNLFLTLAIYEVYVAIDGYLDKIGLSNSRVLDDFKVPLIPGMARATSSALLRSGASKLTGGVSSFISGKIGKSTASATADAGSILSGKMSSDEKANTKAFEPFLQPKEFSKDGKPVNDSNSAVSLTDENGKNKIFAMDGKTGKWKNMETGQALSGDQLSKMNKALENGAHFKMANIAEPNLNLENAARLTDSLNNNSFKTPNGAVMASGMLKGPTGDHEVAFQKNDDGEWSAITEGSAYASPQAAAEAVGATSLDLYSGNAETLDASAVEAAGGSITQAMANHAGISGGAANSPMPANQGFQVLYAGQNEIHGVYADMNGAVKGFSGVTVSDKYAKSHSSQCVQIPNANGHSSWMKINDGTNHMSVNRYVGQTVFKNGSFVNKYNGHSSLHEDGTA